MSGIILCTLVSLSGIIVWIAYNSIYFANPVEFVVAPYYSAVSQAIEGQESPFMQPMNVASVYGMTAMTFYGPAMTAGATWVTLSTENLPKEKPCTKESFCTYSWPFHPLQSSYYLA